MALAEPVEVSSRAAAADDTAAAPMELDTAQAAGQQLLAGGGDGSKENTAEAPVEGLIPAKRLR